MNRIMNEKFEMINDIIINSTSINPIEMIIDIMHKDFMEMHGPVHHYLDGACLLGAYYNAGGDIDLENCLNELASRALQMPGAMCGKWGVCGSSASLGAALSIIHQTSPLSHDQFYKEHMALTSLIIAKEGEIGGPRCCKRNAFIALTTAIQFIKENYHIQLESSDIHCEFSSKNKQCLENNCPFHH